MINPEISTNFESESLPDISLLVGFLETLERFNGLHLNNSDDVWQSSEEDENIELSSFRLIRNNSEQQEELYKELRSYNTLLDQIGLTTECERTFYINDENGSTEENDGVWIYRLLLHIDNRYRLSTFLDQLKKQIEVQEKNKQEVETLFSLLMDQLIHDYDLSFGASDERPVEFLAGLDDWIEKCRELELSPEIINGLRECKAYRDLKCLERYQLLKKSGLLAPVLNQDSNKKDQGTEEWEEILRSQLIDHWKEFQDSEKWRSFLENITEIFSKIKEKCESCKDGNEKEQESSEFILIQIHRTAALISKGLEQMVEETKVSDEDKQAAKQTRDELQEILPQVG